MANEARIQSSLQIRTGSIDYRSTPTAFSADVSGTMGPTPGAFAVSEAGTDVDLSQLDTPGLAKITNIGATDIEFGVYDPSIGVHEFIPCLEWLAGETYVVRLSRFLGQEFGTGTGTAETGSNSTLRVKSIGGAGKLQVEAFER
jgi:hypothetical protein